MKLLNRFPDKKIFPVIVILLLTGFFAVSFTSALKKSPVCDEYAAHVPSGWSYWKRGVFCGGLDNPPLIQLLVSLPLALTQSPFDPSDASAVIYPRTIMILMTLALAVLLFAQARRLYSRLASLMVLVIFLFEPNILAYSRVAVTDMGFTCFAFTSFILLVRYLEKPSLKRCIAAGCLFGAAAASKFTASWLVLNFLVLTIIDIFRKKNDAGKDFIRILKKFSLHALIYAACALFILNSLYLFQGAARWNKVPPVYVQEVLGSHSQAVLHLLNAGAFFLPELYVKGLLNVYYHARHGHQSYLFGERSIEGWSYYHLIAFLLKSTVPFLILTVLALSGSIYNFKNRTAFIERYSLINAGLFFCFISFFGINIGIRHVLPVFPFLILSFGNIPDFLNRLFRFLKKPYIASISVFSCLTILHAASSLSVYPHFISYFNLLAGGPENGSEFLLDSNIDWGQNDLLLEKKLEELNHPVAINPEKPQTGWTAVNVNRLKGLLAEQAEDFLWLDGYPTAFQVGYTWNFYNIDIQSYNEFARRSGSKAYHLWALGLMSLEEDDEEKAILLLEKAVQKSPINSKIVESYVDAALELGLFDKALQAAQKISTLEQKKYTLAEEIEICRKLQREPQNAEYWNNLGVVRNQLNRLKKAYEAYSKAVEIRPKFANAYYNRAYLHFHTGNPEKAEKDVMTALMLTTGFEDAEILANNIQTVKNALGSSDPKAQYFLGNYYASAGKFSKAMEYFFSSFRQMPDCENCLLAYGELYVALKLRTKMNKYLF